MRPIPIRNGTASLDLEERMEGEEAVNECSNGEAGGG